MLSKEDKKRRRESDSSSYPDDNTTSSESNTRPLKRQRTFSSDGADARSPSPEFIRRKPPVLSTSSSDRGPEFFEKTRTVPEPVTPLAGTCIRAAGFSAINDFNRVSGAMAGKAGEDPALEAALTLLKL